MKRFMRNTERVHVSARTKVDFEGGWVCCFQNEALCVYKRRFQTKINDDSNDNIVAELVLCCIPDLIELTCDAIICVGTGVYYVVKAMVPKSRKSKSHRRKSRSKRDRYIPVSSTQSFVPLSRRA
ncbi:unnamed protein product [Somion occarium]|uniref:Uncharacterized protein n=1 Tax=Somion occarium TaxID=3059160 RepID=A0ABP1D4L1_9APHY